MTPTDAAAWIAAVLALPSAVFAGLAWRAARPAQEWSLSPTVGDVAVLTRTRSPRARVDLINVPHRMPLYATDMRYEITGRVLKRGQWIQLKVAGCYPGDQVVVHWRYWSRGKMRYTTLPLVTERPKER